MDWRTILRIHPIESVTNRVAYLLDPDWADIRTNGAFLNLFFEVEEAATLTHIGVAVIDDITSGVGGVPGTFTFTLQGIDSSGNNDGVVKATAGSYTPVPSDQGTFLWLPLTATYGALRGEEMCLRIEKVSGGGSNFGTRYLGPRFNRGRMPYQRLFTGVTNLSSSDQAIYGYRSASRRYGFPTKSIRKTAFNSPGQVGMRFFFSDEIAESAVLSHITWVGRPAVAAGSSYDVIVFDDGGVEQSRVTVDVDHGAATMSSAVGGRDFSSTIYFEDAPEIEFGREYFVLLAPAGGAQSMYVAAWDFNETADANALGGEGEFYLVSRAGASGSFTRDGTARPMIDLGFYDWGISAPPQTGFHVKFIPRYNDNALIEHADDQVVDPRETVEDGEPHEVPGFPIGNAIKSYGGFATVEVFRNPEGTFDASTRIYTERPLEELKLVNWDPFVAGASHLVFRFRAAEGSATFVDVDQYGFLI